MNFMHKVNYMKYAKHWITVSIVLTIAGLLAFFVMGFNKGVDFTGGMLYDLKFEGQVTSKQVSDAASKVFGGEAVVQGAENKGDTSGSEFLLRTPESTREQQDKLFKELESVGKYTKISEDQVSGSVSTELRDRAILAVIIAAVLQIIYLWIRFELKFGVTAVVALLHDTIITIGMVSLFRIQINSAFVAAILTILGYSINDTVIVFDRIRENLAKRKKGESLEDLTTRSIQEVITRSLYTVFTVEFTLVALLIWGGETLKDFAWTLFIGITSGMYSSIFIAAALWLFWQNWADKRHKTAVKPSSKPAKA